MGEPVTVEFVREKQTKNCVRFQEIASNVAGPVIGVLYVQKHNLEDMDINPRIS